jgi:transcriptional regulator with XRE-family HTH domain
VTLKALKPKESDFEPQTLGEHILKRRLQLGLTQKEAARHLGTSSPITVLNWEKGKSEPPIESIPGIIGFLGHYPFPRPGNLSERLLATRRVMGWTIKEAARQLGVDEGTWGYWERTGRIPCKRHRGMVDALLFSQST